MVNEELQSQSSLPLLSKQDHMESFMKQVTKNPNVSRWRCVFSFGKENNECVRLKAPVAQAKNKSYLLDQIESLEDRLIELSLEIESRRASRVANTGPTGSGTREVPASSYPVFNNHKPKCKHASYSDTLPLSTGGELQDEPETLKQKQEQKQKRKNRDSNADNHKTFKSGEKKANGWLHLRLLGC